MHGPMPVLLLEITVVHPLNITISDVGSPKGTVRKISLQGPLKLWSGHPLLYEIAGYRAMNTHCQVTKEQKK